MSEHAIGNAKAWMESVREMIGALSSAGDDCEAEDEARETIQESPLSVLVRGGWHSPGDCDGRDPEEYEILLSTGGPALRIIGELGSFAQPDSARLQWQDWGTPWTDADTTHADDSTLLAFARQFYFGE